MPEPCEYRSNVPVAGLYGGKLPRCVFAVGQCSQVSTDRKSLRDMVASLAEGAWRDFRMTNASTAGHAAKFAASAAVGGAVASKLGATTPLGWLRSGFGPIPAEFTKSGAIQVFQLSAGQRLGRVAFAAGAKFVLVTMAYEGGVLVGSVINQFLSDEVKDAIGGTINEIVNEEGYQELWKHPFGIGTF